MDYDDLEFSDFEPDYEFDVDDGNEEKEVNGKESKAQLQPVSKSLNELADEVFTTEKYKSNPREKPKTAPYYYKRHLKKQVYSSPYDTDQRQDRNHYKPVSKSLNELADEVFTHSAATTEKYKSNPREKPKTAGYIYKRRLKKQVYSLPYDTDQQQDRNHYKVRDIVYPPTLCHDFVEGLIEKAKEFAVGELKLVATKSQRSYIRDWRCDHRYLATPRRKEMGVLKKSSTPYGKCMQEHIKIKKEIDARKAENQDAFDRGEITQEEVKVKLIINKIDRMKAEDESRMYTQQMFGALHHILPLCLLFPQEVKEMKSFEGIPIACQSLIDDKSFNAMLHNRMMILHKHRMYRKHKENPNYDMLLLVQDKNDLMSLHYQRREYMKRFTVFKNDQKKSQFEARLKNYRFMVETLEEHGSEDEVKSQLLYLSQFVKIMELYLSYYDNQNDDQIKIRLYKEASFKSSPACKMFLIQKEYKQALKIVMNMKGPSANHREPSANQRYEKAMERWEKEDQLRDSAPVKESHWNDAQYWKSPEKTQLVAYDNVQHKYSTIKVESEDEKDEMQPLDTYEEAMDIESAIYNDQPLVQNKSLDKFDSDTSYPISKERQQEMYGNSGLKRQCHDNPDFEPKRMKSHSTFQLPYHPTSHENYSDKMPILPLLNSSQGYQSPHNKGAQILGRKENYGMDVRATFNSEHDQLSRDMTYQSLNNHGAQILGRKENYGMDVGATFNSEHDQLSRDMTLPPLPHSNGGLGWETMHTRIDIFTQKINYDQGCRKLRPVNMNPNARDFNPQLGVTHPFPPPPRGVAAHPRFRANSPHLQPRAFLSNPQARAFDNGNFNHSRLPFNGALHQNRMQSNRFMPPLPKLERFSSRPRLHQSQRLNNAIPQQRCRYQPGLY